MENNSINKGIILSKKHCLPLQASGNDLNNNIVIVGATGSGKTRNFVKPNILQKNTGYIITNVKGNMLEECTEILTHKQKEDDKEYAVRILNLANTVKSMHYNPFSYITNEDGIHSLAHFIVTNSNDGHGIADEVFWRQTATMLLTSLIGYVYYNMREEDRNFNSVMEMLEIAKERISVLDMIFRKKKEKCGDCFEVRFYENYRGTGEKTRINIAKTLYSALSSFNLPSMKEILQYDELELDKTGDEYTALFVITSETDFSKNILAGILYSQLFNILSKKTDVGHGKLNIPVRFLLDDFAHINMIPQFDAVISTCSRNVSFCIILKDESQLYNLYENTASTIIGNCDTYLFMGSNDLKTCGRVAERIHEEIDTVLHMPAGECYIISRDNVLHDTQYDVREHKRYKDDISVNHD